MPYANKFDMITAMKRLIAYFHSSATAASHLKVNGAYAAANLRNWTIIRIDMVSPEQIHDDISYWQPDGCIVDAVTSDRLIFGLRAFARQPTVFIDCPPECSKMNISTLVQDDSAVARAAAEELLRHNLKSYAYVAWPGRLFWSEKRGESFKCAIKARGRDIRIFRIEKKRPKRKSVVKALSEWLRKLPMPAGIFTATDAMSAQVLEAAEVTGLRVPEDIMVIGTDNDAYFCENMRPMLSSVSLGFHSAGGRAVEILQTLLDAPSRQPIHETFKEVRLVTRASTKRSIKHDHAATMALDMIRERAASGITAGEALSCFSCSRRLAERRFKDIAGRSAIDEIHAVQIEKAKELAINPFIKLTAIPQMCGHTSAPYFQRLFKRETGCTMKEYRKRSSRI